jgi:hypothetical protein
MKQTPFPAVEVALALWIAIWVLTGYLVDRQVEGIAKLGDTVVLAGKSMRSTAEALDALGTIPVVGSTVRPLAANAQTTAASAIVNGRQAHSDADRLGTLLWITLAAAPTVPAIVWYLSFRYRRRLGIA